MFRLIAYIRQKLRAKKTPVNSVYVVNQSGQWIVQDWVSDATEQVNEIRINLN